MECYFAALDVNREAEKDDQGDQHEPSSDDHDLS